jgi:NAD(P)-dependent dehydrogenase (short-subunit alcohol dehydrogenase family)
MAGMLDNKVVVISGVGPALGTTLGRRCAEAGADLVLAARTVERLDDVAKQITDMGRRAVAMGTDITDEEQVNNLVEASLAAYGKVDVLVNNAFRVPSMKPLANTTFQHIRDAIELTVLGALRLTQGFTPALAEAKGSVVNVNSMVVRHSQAKYVPTRSPSRRCWRCRSHWPPNWVNRVSGSIRLYRAISGARL